MKTLDVPKEVLAGKRMSESSRRNYKAVFSSLNKFSEDFPVKSVEVNKWLVSLHCTGVGQLETLGWNAFLYTAESAQDTK